MKFGETNSIQPQNISTPPLQEKWRSRVSLTRVVHQSFQSLQSKAVRLMQTHTTQCFTIFRRQLRVSKTPSMLTNGFILLQDCVCSHGTTMCQDLLRCFLEEALGYPPYSNIKTATYIHIFSHLSLEKREVVENVSAANLVYSLLQNIHNL